MTQLLHPVEPFGEVNVRPQPGGALEIVATMLMEPDIEGARCGLALDGSASMKGLYGANGIGMFAKKENFVEPVAQQMAAYLAKFSATGSVNMIYWACAPDGSGIEEIGEATESSSAKLAIGGPKKLSWGRRTKLLPPVRHFVDGVFRSADWAIAVFITDGIIEDLEEVKQFCFRYARQLTTGQRKFCKLVLIGLGPDVDEKQMEELDDMFEGSGLKMPDGEDIDIWDHKLAGEMRQLHEVFAEVVSEKMIVADHGRILDPNGRVVVNYSDGVPALLRFTLPRGSTSFVLELNGHRIVQDLSEALARV
jgi:hypothetical protein